MTTKSDHMLYAYYTTKQVNVSSQLPVTHWSS